MHENKRKTVKQTHSLTESTLDPPYGEIQEILVLFKINNYRERYTIMQAIKSNLAISNYT